MSYQMLFGFCEILHDWWNLSEVQFEFCEISSHSDFTERCDMPEFWYDVGILVSFSIIDVFHQGIYFECTYALLKCYDCMKQLLHGFKYNFLPLRSHT